ncbi:MAG: class III extradiol ring-cleavage dioxygenase, partial [Acidaminococcus sp.]|nr:class III extradiol ring-cleavage dioxygenase [Acidaminococcus sp.]
HMNPKADIPVVQLSVDGYIPYAEDYEIGRKHAAQRAEGYLIVGSGNVVHNLRAVEWENKGGSPATLRFNDYITEAVLKGETDKVIGFSSHPDAAYAVPTPDHYLPLLVCLGAAEGDKATVFNKVCNLGSMAMTGFVWE